jgi:NhaP-type Na+/H+ or K+/H+ antiporter
MTFAGWSLFIGVLLLSLVLLGTWLGRLPLSSAMLYLFLGWGLGPDGLNLLMPDPSRYAALLEGASEAALLISLFAVGLKLGLPLSDRGWRLPAAPGPGFDDHHGGPDRRHRRAGPGAFPGRGRAARRHPRPTDPVLASDVQVLEAGDRDRLRFSLTGEGGLNDGAAFPFVMLGLGLLGLHDLGAWAGAGWGLVDVVWAVAGGWPSAPCWAR